MSYSFGIPTINNLTGYPISVSGGGTGHTTWSTGQLLYASGASAISGLSDVSAGQVLTSAGAGNPPVWDKINPTSLSGVIGVSSGGTGQSSLTSNAVLLGNGTSGIQSVSMGSATILGTSAFGGAPQALSTVPLAVQANTTEVGVVDTGTWQANPINSAYIAQNLSGKMFTGCTLSGTTFVPSLSGSQLVTVSSSGTLISTNQLSSTVMGNITALGAVTSGSVTSSVLPSTISGKTLTTATLNNPTFSGLGSPLGGAPSTIMTLDGTNKIQARDISTSLNTLLVTEGGTGSVASLSGSAIMISLSGAIVQGGFGSSTTILHGGSAPTYSKVDLVNDISGVLGLGNGGTGLTNTTPGNGKLLIGNGTGYTLANITGGTSINVTNSAGGILIDCTVASSTAGTLYIQTTDKTGGASTTSAVSVISSTGSGSLTIPANSLAVSDIIRFKMAGLFNSQATAETGTFVAKLGSTTIVSVGSSVPSSKTNTNWYCEGELNIQAIGATGKVSGYLTYYINDSASGAYQNAGSASLITVDTTSSQTFDLTFAYSASSSSNNWTTKLFSLSKN